MPSELIYGDDVPRRAGRGIEPSLTLIAHQRANRTEGLGTEFLKSII